MVRRANTDIPACQREKLVNAIDRTLLTLEQKGGPKAAINIKVCLIYYNLLINYILFSANHSRIPVILQWQLWLKSFVNLNKFVNKLNIHDFI